MSSAPYIRTGAMRHRAELQSEVSTPDGGGGSAVVWTKERDLWCQIRPLSGAMRLQGAQRESQVSHEIYTRYQSDVAPGTVNRKRIVYGGKAYRIEAAWQPAELPEFVHMTAIEGAAT
jgi:SPP1 family predicted phage head-tail adaptor